MVEYFNFYYFLYIAFAFGLLTGLYFLLRNKSQKTSTIVLFCLLAANLLLHFFKLSFASYQDWMPQAIRTITPENICAVDILVFPWFFLSKKNVLKDYMFYMGVMGGIGATFLPIDVIGRDAFALESMRFYFSHILIWVVPLLMVLLKLHTLDYKRIIKVPLLIYSVLGIILINEIILTGAGFVPLDYLYSNEFRNSAFIFGPLAAIGFLGELFTALTPKLFLTIPIGENAGAAYYWPIIWLVIPAFIYFSILAFLLSLPFEYKRIKKDMLTIKNSIIKKWITRNR